MLYERQKWALLTVQEFAERLLLSLLVESCQQWLVSHVDDGLGTLHQYLTIRFPMQHQLRLRNDNNYHRVRKPKEEVSVKRTEESWSERLP